MEAGCGGGEDYRLGFLGIDETAPRSVWASQPGHLSPLGPAHHHVDVAAAARQAYQPLPPIQDRHVGAIPCAPAQPDLAQPDAGTFCTNRGAQSLGAASNHQPEETNPGFSFCPLSPTAVCFRNQHMGMGLGRFGYVFLIA